MHSPIKVRKSKASGSTATPHRLSESSYTSPLSLDQGIPLNLEEPFLPIHDGSTTPHCQESRAVQLWTKWQRRLPILRKLQQQVLKVPPRYRWAFVIVWCGWKIILAIAMIVVFLQPTNATSSSGNAISTTSVSIRTPLISQTRVLYIVTSLVEFNIGHRNTIRGQDRLGEIVIPILADSIQTMVQSPFHYHVDVYFICAYSLSAERENQIQQALPFGVGLQVWDDASPMGYELKDSPTKVINVHRALARQHRYVIKDKFPFYDLFLAFEDDMRVSGQHIQHYLTMSNEINLLRDRASSKAELEESQKLVPENLVDHRLTKFYGDMTKEQLSRVIPGFIRVEVLLNQTAKRTQTDILPIEQDYHFPEHPDTEIHVDPEPCCHVKVKSDFGIPESPKFDDLVIWETNIKAFSLRQLPSGSSYLDWVVLMMEPGKNISVKQLLGGYWSGREGAFGDEPRLSGDAPTLIAQQGGWMLTRDQIFRMNNGLCTGSFLPPFDEPTFFSDGQESMNVEFWSGSYQIFTGVRGGCNMQRIISIHPDHFSKHLIYHVSNNKQRQLTQHRMVRADHLFGQFNTVKKMAQRAMEASIRSRTS